MIDIEALLKSVSDEQPCGPNLTYDPAFYELENQSRGKPETQFSPAEDPNWKDLREMALGFLGKSKHLTAAVIVTVCELKLNGMGGVEQGFELVRGLLERHWAAFYPQLDPEDNNDPTERMNILSNLTSFADPYRFLSRLQEAPLCQSTSFGRVRYLDVERAKQPSAEAPPEGQPTPLSESQIQAAFQDTSPELIAGNHLAAVKAGEHLAAIDSFLNSTVGTAGVDLEPLRKLLKNIETTLAAYLPVGAEAGVDGATEAGAVAGGGSSSGPRLSGTVQSRDDVVKALDRICDYYRQQEPSSPVPYILKRAQRMVKMNFMEIVNELTPDAMTQVRVITGPDETTTT
jgi:type VI secretion system protein ImpA